MSVISEKHPLIGKQNHPCLLCGDSVAIEGEGCLGKIVGNQIICDGCLRELKEALDKV